VNSPEDLKKAKEFCFRLIKIRQRSEHELRQRLGLKKFSLDIIDEVIGYLKRLILIDDVEFAANWVASRKHNFGSRRIAFELKQKGIAESIIKQELDKLKEDFNEAEYISGIARKKFEKIVKELKDPFKAKKRLYGFFMRKGYPIDVIIDTLEKL